MNDWGSVSCTSVLYITRYDDFYILYIFYHPFFLMNDWGSVYCTSVLYVTHYDDFYILYLIILFSSRIIDIYQENYFFLVLRLISHVSNLTSSLNSFCIASTFLLLNSVTHSAINMTLGPVSMSENSVLSIHGPYPHLGASSGSVKLERTN